LDRLGRYEPAARIAGFALGPPTSGAVPEITTAIAHLRMPLGDQTYDDATCACDQIDQARAELNAVPK
jgi:hypothetical protein